MRDATAAISVRRGGVLTLMYVKEQRENASQMRGVVMQVKVLSSSRWLRHEHDERFRCSIANCDV